MPGRTRGLRTKSVTFAPMEKKVRVRFAPSPTGGLHLGGMRTVLFNYLFARHHHGTFVLRIEDTDQSRFVDGAEDYIQKCLEWCGLTPDEGPWNGGPYGPYRQSERKDMYRKYAETLVEHGWAYYAFDTPEELEAMRHQFRSEENPSPQYGKNTRHAMRNSLSMSPDEVRAAMDAGTPYVVRFLMPDDQEVGFNDMIRGHIRFNTANLDDKVLLKADGMPTYHLAVVVDDYHMKISHAFRGEEWLPSAPLHVLLWERLGWKDHMPEWAHLPLILKPDGNGKLSKRDAERLGFPIYAMNWLDPRTGELTKGFREMGFMPEAFVNLLAMLGWNDGSGQELFSIQELIERFQMDRVHKGGAKFDFEKAKWFNHEYIKTSPASRLVPEFLNLASSHGLSPDPLKAAQVIDLIKERCTFLGDLWDNAWFFFKAPETLDKESILKKWSSEKHEFFTSLSFALEPLEHQDIESLETLFQSLAASHQLKPGELQLPLRIMLVGGKFGPPVFAIMSMLGMQESKRRIDAALADLNA